MTIVLERTMPSGTSSAGRAARTSTDRRQAASRAWRVRLFSEGREPWPIHKRQGLAAC